MKDVLGVIMKNLEGDNLSMLMVTEAYDTPAFHGETYKRQAVGEFSNKYYLTCVKVMQARHQ